MELTNLNKEVEDALKSKIGLDFIMDIVEMEINFIESFESKISE